MLHVDDVHSLDHLGRDFLDVAFIVLGDDDGVDAGALGAEQLFTEAADGQHAAAQGDFAGHGDIVAHRDTQEGTGDGRGDGDAG